MAFIVVPFGTKIAREKEGINKTSRSGLFSAFWPKTCFIIPIGMKLGAVILSGPDEVDGLLRRHVKCHDAVVRSRNEESRP